MNAIPEPVLVDSKWLDQQMAVVLLHPTCAKKVVEFYRMKPAEAKARYRLFVGEVRDDDCCDVCRKSLVWSLAEHLVPVEAECLPTL